MGRPSAAHAPLSPREREVVAHLVRGLSRRQIAARLGTRPETVKTQLERVYAKLGLDGRYAVAAWAAERETTP